MYPPSWVPIPVQRKNMEIAYSFDRKEYLSHEIVISQNPKVVFKVAGCNRNSCLPDNPLSFELVSESKIAISLSKKSELFIGEKRLSVVISNQISNFDGLRHIKFIAIQGKVEELNGAKLAIGHLQIEGVPIVHTNVWFSYKAEVTTEIMYMGSPK